MKYTKQVRMLFVKKNCNTTLKNTDGKMHCEESLFGFS